MGNYRRIKFDAKDLNEAMAKAEYLLENDGNLSPSNNNQDSMPVIHIADAIIRASNSKNWTSYTREKDQLYCKFFLKWVDKKKLVYWHELDYEKILQYKNELVKKNLAFDTVRLYLVPVRRTARWISAQYPKHYYNFCENIRLSRDELYSKSYDDTAGNPYIPLTSILDLLDWLTRPIAGQNQENRNQIAAGIALQGIAGLQLQEAFRLQAKKFDPVNSTITIDTEVKNRYRIRKIPIPNIVSALLQQILPEDPESRFINAYSHFNGT